MCHSSSVSSSVSLYASRNARMNSVEVGTIRVSFI